MTGHSVTVRGTGSEGGPPASPDEALREARMDEAADARRRERWTTGRLAEARDLVDELLATTGRPVVLHLSCGTTVRGATSRAGADVVEVVGAATALVRLGAVVAAQVEDGPGAHPPPQAPIGWTFDSALADLVGTGTEVVVGLAGGHSVRGEVVATGRTVVVRGISSTTSVATAAVTHLRR